MALVIPDIESITNGSNGYDFQAAPDKTDQDAINAALNATAYVISGMTVSQHTGSDMLVSVASGYYSINRVIYSYAGGTATVTGASATDRRDIVSIDTSGTLHVTAGTACGTSGWVRTNSSLPPVKPSIPANQCLLGEVAVPSSVSAVVNIMITDKTVPLGNFVVGSSASTSPLIIPGLSGSADIIPVSPSSYNDEFDENGAGAPAGWSRTDTSGGSWGSLTTINTSDILSHLHIAETSSSSLIQGIYKQGPSPTFTMTAKLADGTMQNQYQNCGIWASSVAPGNSGTLYCMNTTGTGAGNASLIQTQSANAQTGAGGAGTSWGNPGLAPLYLRAKVTATSIQLFFSYSGLVWMGATSNTGLTVTNAWVGLFVNAGGSGTGCEAAFDWVRFT